MSTPPEAQKTVSEGRRWFCRLPRWEMRKPLTLRISYRGGGECWYEVHTRGGVVRFPGHTALHDMMEVVYGGRLSSSPRS